MALKIMKIDPEPLKGDDKCDFLGLVPGDKK